LIVDFHTHILPPSFKSRRTEIASKDATFAALFATDKAKMATSQELIAAMDEDGVDVSVVLGYGWCDPDIGREANDYLLNAADRHKGRIIPFCSVHPDWDDAALREIEHCVDGGARGIGELHPSSQRINLAKDRHLPQIMAFAADKGLPVVVHGSEPVGHSYAGKGDTHPQGLLEMIERFPGVRLVGAHWGGGLPFYALMPEVKEALSNTYFDSATSPFLYAPEIYSTMAAAVGHERLLFGSDFPLVRASRVAEEAIAALNATQAQAFLGGNAQELLGLA
jgi:predicted TIM-barrel fold metal-dependent hydrolase